MYIKQHLHQLHWQHVVKQIARESAVNEISYGTLESLMQFYSALVSNLCCQ